MTLEEEQELINLGQKWIAEARSNLNDSTKPGHQGTGRGFEDLGRAQGKGEAADDLDKFLEKHSISGKLNYIKNLMEENK